MSAFIVTGITLDVSVQISLDAANERKRQGNDLFRVGKWEEAMTTYRSALECLPKRMISAPGQRSADSDTLSDSGEVGDESQGLGESSGSKSTGTTNEKEEEVIEVVTPAVEQSEREMKTLRAVLNANIAACYQKLVRPSSIQF
jgi:hypothetical protein